MNEETTIESYVKVLKPFYLSQQQIIGENIICECDNASPHQGENAMKWIQDNQIKHAKFGGGKKFCKNRGGRAGNSPDICPIEQVFAIWQEKVAQRCPHTKSDMIKIATEEWDKIPQEQIQNCFNHCAKAMAFVKQNNGDMCKN
jgi:hypothetical protein